jgi:hypothetical protein
MDEISRTARRLDTSAPQGDFQEHDAREFCQANGFTFESKHGWWYVKNRKHIIAEYKPATGLMRFIPCQPRFTGKQADYQVSDWSGVESIIRSRTRWSVKSESSSQSKSE